VNGRVINSPALDVTANDVVAVDGKIRRRASAAAVHVSKPRGLMTTHDDPEGRPTVFDNLPEGLPRLISIGRSTSTRKVCCSPMTAGCARWNCLTPAGCGAIACAPMAR
jgi:hypothetical protein